MLPKRLDDMRRGMEMETASELATLFSCNFNVTRGGGLLCRGSEKEGNFYISASFSFKWQCVPVTIVIFARSFCLWSIPCQIRNFIQLH